jgi:hypothetical protein
MVPQPPIRFLKLPGFGAQAAMKPMVESEPQS